MLKAARADERRRVGGSVRDHFEARDLGRPGGGGEPTVKALACGQVHSLVVWSTDSTWASPRGLLEMQDCRPHPRCTESEPAFSQALSFEFEERGCKLRTEERSGEPGLSSEEAKDRRVV